jgi:hypothetical protein
MKPFPSKRTKIMNDKIVLVTYNDQTNVATQSKQRK